MLHNEAAFITRLFLGAHWDIWLPGAPPGLEVAGGLVVIAALCATTLRHRALLPAVLWLVAAPLPYVLWPHGTAVSRYYYAPSTAIAAITALALWRLTRVSRNAGIVLVALLCCASLFSLHRVLAIQYAYSGAFHFNTRHDPGQALLQYQRSVDIHVYPENAAAILGNRAKALLLTGRAPEASKAFLDLLSRYPNRRDFYVASGDLGIAADPSGSQEVTEQMLVAAEQQLRVLRDAAAAAGDTARVAGLDRLRRYYFAR
jgi:hypothetical protein